ncbi:hypothetical protein [Halorubrum sp. CSM-61]|uniref:hypothetical protein n=1 Tax=Halorubrum sp. CSM-61 TaxID=2485838 RepID=UPI001F14BB98|nr:hypothetical protein [Halorubrum sp. CSM-61]
MTALAGCSGFGDSQESPSQEFEGASESGEREGLTSSIPDIRLDTARFASERSFDNDGYERMHLYRKSRAVETLLGDPRVNDLVGDWIGAFEVYEVLTNHLEVVSLQGPASFTVEEIGFPYPGEEISEDAEATFEITAEERQTVYGLIDRHTDEIVGLEITEPEDVSWEKTQNAEDIEHGHLILESDVVQEEFGDLSEYKWYPSWKGSGGGFTGLGAGDLRHGMGGTAALYVEDDGELKVISAFLDGSGDEPELINVTVVDNAVEYQPPDLASDVVPVENSVVDEVPGVPFEKRPYYTANEGWHRIEPPESSFEQSDWSIEWQDPTYEGITMTGSYNGKPVFEALNTPMTITGYYLPPREGRMTREYYFPDDDTVFTGDLAFWDVHGTDFGGPGLLSKIDFPADNGRPSGFQLKTHYHTGAEGLESVDFHSGFRFGPYNYDIAYDFYEDGVLRPVFRRAGPGFVKQFVNKVQANSESYAENGSYEERVVQHYTSTQAFDITPGTESGVAVELFDGDEWTEPDEEFYVGGDPGMKARFSNPDGPEAVDIPLDDDTELVVVRRHEDEIGPGEATAERLVDEETPSNLYHPAQYVDGESIQGERLIVWLLMVGATNQVPYPSGTTNFTTTGHIELTGYE